MITEASNITYQDATFIVDAVNNYECLQAINAQLLEALREARAYIEIGGSRFSTLPVIDAAIAAAESK